MNKLLQQHASSMIKGADTPANQLRNLLNQIEISLGQIQMKSSKALEEIPILFDRTVELLDSLETSGANVSSEYARLNTVSAAFRKNAAQYIKALGGQNSYIALRSEYNPDKDRWWWFLDVYLDNQNRLKRKKSLRTIIISLGVFSALVLVYVLFLAPDKETREVMNFQNNAEQALASGLPEEALVSLKQALAIRPEDDRLLILNGIAALLTGDDNLADESFKHAQAIIGDDIEFLATRAQVYLAAGLAEHALQDAEKALILDPESAISNYNKGLAANALGDTQTAYFALEAAAQYARQEGKIELEGMARIQLAYLTQDLVNVRPTLEVDK